MKYVPKEKLEQIIRDSAEEATKSVSNAIADHITDNAISASKNASKAAASGDAIKVADKASDATKAIDAANIERTFNPNPKHGAAAHGNIPFYNNPEAGQVALNKAVSDPTGKKQLYGIHDGKIIKFQPDNAGGYHAYFVDNTNSEITPRVLREMRRNGLISNVEYNKFIHNKK